MHSIDAGTVLLAATRHGSSFDPWFLAGFLVFIAFAIVFVFFIVAPLMVLVIHRQLPAPEIVPHDPSPIPTPVDEFFNDLGPRLADLGFGETQRWSCRGFATNVASEICTMVDRRRRVLGVGSVMHVRRRGVFRLHSRFFEFSTRSEDGRTLVTSNSATPLPYTEVGNRRHVQLPSLLDPAALLMAHEKLSARDGLAASAREPATREEIPGRIRDAVAESHAWQVQRGLLKVLPGGMYRLTLKGAFLYTWSAIPPGKQILRRRRAAREKALLRELGL